MERRFYRNQLPCVVQRITHHSCAMASSPTRSKEREVEEAAMPGQPTSARALEIVPLAIHPRELPAAASVTAIIVRQT
jgi:hypothetical protein